MSNILLQLALSQTSGLETRIWLVLVWTISHAAQRKLVGRTGVTAVRQLQEISSFFSVFFGIALACPLPFTSCPRHAIRVGPGGLLCLAFTTMAPQWLLRIA